MPILTVKQNDRTTTVYFEKGVLLDELLTEYGFKIPHVCGGRGKCGKCAVDINGDISEETSIEKEFGKRLSCRIVLYGDATVELKAQESIASIDAGKPRDDLSNINTACGLGAAVDIGTTTIAVKLCDLANNKIIGTKTAINPQVSVSGDVIGRISKAASGEYDLLKTLVNEEVKTMIDAIAAEHHLLNNVEKTIITGNTSMLYLYTGTDTKKLGTYPFITDELFDFEQTLNDVDTYFPPCVSAFVGADLLCAVLESGMTEKNEVSLLCDIGTNNEIALYKDGILTVTSTAAGPVFEGAGITHGCMGIKGAIDKVWLENGVINIHTIEEDIPCGICGSGVIDSVAVGLKTGIIDKNGTMSSEICFYNDIVFTQDDVRAVQLAKSAILSGIQALTKICGITEDEIKTVYVAGGFGKHIDIENAESIGLFPKGFSEKTKILGNAALDGAVKLLFDGEQIKRIRKIALICKCINLGGNEYFNDLYIKNMSF